MKREEDPSGIVTGYPLDSLPESYNPPAYTYSGTQNALPSAPPYELLGYSLPPQRDDNLASPPRNNSPTTSHSALTFYEPNTVTASTSTSGNQPNRVTASAFTAPTCYSTPNPNPPDPSLWPCCCCSCGTPIVFFVVIMMVYGLWFPKLPKFKIDSVLFSPFNPIVSDSLFNATTALSQVRFAQCNINFTFENPDKYYTVQYKKIHADLFYREDLISKASAYHFHQKPKTKTMEPVRFMVANDGVGKDVEEFIKNRREVTFNVRMAVHVKFRRGGWLTMYHTMWVAFDDIEVPFLSSLEAGTLYGGSIMCRRHH